MCIFTSIKILTSDRVYTDRIDFPNGLFTTEPLYLLSFIHINYVRANILNDLTKGTKENRKYLTKKNNFKISESNKRPNQIE